MSPHIYCELPGTVTPEDRTERAFRASTPIINAKSLFAHEHSLKTTVISLLILARNAPSPHNGTVLFHLEVKLFSKMLQRGKFNPEKGQYLSPNKSHLRR